MNDAIKDSLLAKIQEMTCEIKEENFGKMADGKLLKVYMKLNSHNKKLALIQ